MSGRFVVTGANGFIGRRLCAALRSRGRVVALLRRGVETGPWDDAIVVDLARDEVPAEVLRSASAVFHLAGKAHAVAERGGDDAEYRLVNVEGTRCVVEAASAAGVARLVFASSVKAMGEDGGSAGPTTPYGRSKRDAEAIVLAGVAEPVVLRLPLVYGPGVEGNLGAMLRAVRARRFPPPPRVENPRSMIHVDDVVRAAVAAAERPAVGGRVLVLGDGVAYTTHAIYASMQRALGRNAPARALPTPVWRALARLGDAAGAVAGRRAPFDSDAYRKLFGPAWYPAADLGAVLGVTGLRTLDDALPEMISGEDKTPC